MTAVVVNHDTATDVHELLPRLVHPQVDVVVVDNASQVPPQVSTDNARLFVQPDNIGWSRGCNAGAEHALAPVLAFVNPDCHPTADQLLALAQSLDDESVGAVAPRFVDADGKPQAFYFRFPRPVDGLFCFLPAGQRIDEWIGSPFIRRRTYDFGAGLPGDVDQPGAACLLVRRDDFTAMGGFDEQMFLFFADTDLCRRFHDRGLSIRVEWDVPVVHVGGSSVRQLPQARQREHMQRDYVVYLRRHHGRATVVLTKLAAVVLSGLLPAAWHALRLRPRSAWEQLRATTRVVTA